MKSNAHAHNDHVVLWYYLGAMAERRGRRWWSYEFWRQWHAHELRAGGLI